MDNTAPQNLRKTPICDSHLALGARMVSFGGWWMPLQFKGIVEENLAVRSGAGLFDISHMGQVGIHGSNATAFLDYLLPNHIDLLRPGQILYSPMCNEKGGIIDDLLVFRRDETDYLLVVNAGRKDVDLDWIRTHAESYGEVTAVDLSDSYAMVALQGPGAERILNLHTGVDLQAIPYYQFEVGRLGEVETIISRTGYSGEDGFEIICPWEDGPTIWNRLLQGPEALRVVPTGLGSRDTLRLEAAYPLYGNDISEKTTPLEAKLGWTVKFDKPGKFIGRGALIRQKEEGIPRRLVGLRMCGRGIPRHDQRILNSGGESVGRITSGTYSPTLKKGIALGYAAWGFNKVGTRLEVEIRNRREPVELVKLPFLESHVKK